MVIVLVSVDLLILTAMVGGLVAAAYWPSVSRLPSLVPGLHHPAERRPQPLSLKRRFRKLIWLAIICCLLAVPALLTFWE